MTTPHDRVHNHQFSVDELVGELRRTADGLSTPWRAVNEMSVGFRAKELALLAARTGHGKTSALVNLALYWLTLGTQGGLDGKVIFYSHEEPPEHILCRLLALLAVQPIEPWTVTEIRAFLSEGRRASGGGFKRDPAQLDLAMSRLKQMEDRFLVLHKPSWTAEQIAEHARGVARQDGVAGVFVDYLQRIPAPVDTRTRDQVVAAIGRSLKTMAVEVAAPVVSGVQVDRSVIPQGYQEKIRKAALGSVNDAIEAMKTARPDLNYLREGGSEQEADLIIGLMNYAADLRMDVSALKARTDHFEFGVLKNRYGPTGQWAAVSYSGATGRLVDCASERAAA